MTPDQEKWLRVFAERLGWERKSPISNYWWVPEEAGWHPLEWLLTPDGKDYLIQRAREALREARKHINRFCEEPGHIYEYLCDDAIGAIKKGLGEWLLPNPARIAEAAADAMEVTE